MKYIKIKALVSIIINSCQKEYYGIPLSKLYKILYFIDFGHYAKYNEPVSDFEYLRFKFGPVPKGLNDYLNLLEDEKLIDRRKKQTNYGEHDIFELYPDKGVVSYSFTEEETDTIDKTLEFFKDKSGANASRKTHYQSPWITTKNGEIIPFDLAKYCDFEWLGYTYDGKSSEELQEIKHDREMFQNSERLRGLMNKIQKL